MKNKNFKLQQLITERRMSQAEVAKLANISSESRLSWLINLLIEPLDCELERLSFVLNVKIEDLGFKGSNNGGK
jgi:transcriptional regulator with XRE-family HTH domain